MGVTLQAIFQRGFESFARGRRLPVHVYKAARFIARCHTAAMGRHVRVCPNGHLSKIYFNSCRHRACPQCGNAALDAWIEKRNAQMLACGHFLVTFTVPSDLDELWHLQRQRMNEILFACSRDTLLELLEDPKYLGATPGVIAMLHTWGRTLTFHPHVHALVTAGGWDGESWRPIRNGYLLPGRVLAALFRGKLIGALRRALERGELVLPEGDSRERWENRLRTIERQRFGVHIAPPRGHSTRGILLYLGHYLRGGPIRNSRLLSVDERGVRFRYTDHRDQRSKVMELPLEAFIRRICWHVPEPKRHSVRMWGIYARRRVGDLEQARAALPTPVPLCSPEPIASAKTPIAEACPLCGAPLVFSRMLPAVVPSRAPP